MTCHHPVPIRIRDLNRIEGVDLRHVLSDVSSAGSATTSTFETALTFNAIVFGVELAVFTLLRPYFKQIYEPRTVTPVESERATPFTAGMFTWPLALFKADYRDIKRVNGPDAYLFVRFLRMMVRVFLPIWIVSWAVLLPVTSVNNSVPGNTGLDRFTIGNVAPNNQNRFAAHIILVWISTFWIYWNIRHEMRHFVTVRQLHLIDPTHSRTAQANTILVTGIPSKFLSEKALAQLYSHLPGGVKKVWINRDLKDLPAVYDRRLAACGKLESAETSLLATATKIRAKQFKKSGNRADKDESPPQTVDQAERNLSLAESLVPRAKRPTHRLPAGFLPFALPFIGKKVDTIEWSRTEIAASTALLRQARRTVSESPLPVPQDTNEDGKVDAEDRPEQTYPPLSSAFITFNQQISAHMAYRTLTHHEPYRMADRYLEVAPENVLWGNLGMNPYEKRVRMVISYAATAALILLWAFPVAFVGIISNIEGLCVRYSWLAWLCTIPKVVLGIIEGILPPVMLAVLMMLLPIVLRLFARFEGIPTRTGLELSLMTRYFIFHVIHSFLIVTLSSGLIAALPGLLENPGSAATLLAQYLPQASTFFLTYIILQGLSGSAGGFLAVVQLVLYYVKLFILGSTARSVYGIKFGPRTVAWGTLFPSITLLTVITLGYSIISPIINGLAVFAFFLFYQLYKYLFLYQYTQPHSTDTGGLFYPKAIQHVFVGLYVQQICLCALFFLARDENGNAGAIPEGILMIVLIALTAGFQSIINSSYGPLISALPLSIADKTYKAEESPEDAGRASIEKRRETLDSVHMPMPSPSHQHPSRSIGKESLIQEQPIHPRSRSTHSESSGPTSPLDDSYFSKLPDGRVDYGFAHPALTRPQRVVWIPDDTLGLGKEEAKANYETGVLATTEGATMDEKANVEVRAAPVDLGKFE
ncbi:hypothetical protein PAXRUDRAFT_34109 [Paxillus rubicundulus Ve08.2h10]|uniref:DUF221-domain-containing protein n=1 Tax=Paxillus rubicundulus Ve08.2h10 TaxID=930991 RepID=A0A0D0E6L0_9AGAM|nr:hypothetical protein PAXRUDRAFT_34109 [Paxillus rubicundulus Ve08.2h10]